MPEYLGNFLPNEIIGSEVADRINGLGGDDLLSGLGGDDRLLGGAGDDVADGGAGGDTLRGADGADTLLGGAGEDRLIGGSGIDLLDGGDGGDTYVVFARDTGGPDVYSDSGNIGTDLLDATRVDRLLLPAEFDAASGLDAIRGDIGNPLTLMGGSQSVVWDFDHFELLYVHLIIGTPAADWIHGSDSDDRIRGGGGEDVLMGGNGDDVLIGGGGADQLFGHAGADMLTGGGGADFLDGGDGGDTYIYRGNASPLDDTIADSGSSGLDVLDLSALATLQLTAEFDAGTGGIEKFIGDSGFGHGMVFTAPDAAVTWDFSGVRLEFFDGIVGSAFTDLVLGSTGDDRIRGRDGDDVLLGGAGNDQLVGAGGADILYGGDANDTVKGGGGDDVLYGNAGADELRGGAGNDFLDGGDGEDTLRGGDGNDVIVFDAADTLVDGQGGEDRLTLEGTTGFTLDLIGNAAVGLWGIEHIDLAGGGNVLVLDKTSALDISFTSNVLTVDGNADNSVLAVGDEWVESAAPVDGYHVFQNGVMTLRIAEGLDLAGINVEGNQAPLLEINDPLAVDAGSTTLISSMLLQSSDPDDDPAGIIYTITAIPVHGVLYLDGQALDVGATFTQQDIDFARLEYAQTADGAPDDGFSFTVDDGNEDDTAPEPQVFSIVINAVISGGNGNDVLQGGAGDDMIHGAGGNDTLLGGAGDDELIGGPGVDFLDGGAGSDTYIPDDNAKFSVQPTDDGSIYSSGAVIDFQYLMASGDIRGAVEFEIPDTTGDIATVLLSVNPYGLPLWDDELEVYGYESEDGSLTFDDYDAGTLLGTIVLTGAGYGVQRYFDVTAFVTTATSDYVGFILHSDEGTALLSSLEHNYGNPALLIFEYALEPDIFQDSGDAPGEVDKLDLSGFTSHALGNFDHAGTGIEIIAGDTNGTTLVAGGPAVTWDFSGVELVGIKRISGADGSDFITGSAGADVLGGGTGNDLLEGGAGNDVYVFDTAPAADNVDLIGSFAGAGALPADLIHLDNGAGLFEQVGAEGVLSGAAFESGAGLAEAATGSGRIIYDTASGNLYYDADGAGGAEAVRFAVLLTHPDALSAADFVII